jgi:hypothetical protein
MLLSKSILGYILFLGIFSIVFADEPIDYLEKYYGIYSDAELFRQIVIAVSEPHHYTDKVTSHRYSTMYGQFLIPYVRRKHMRQEHVKFLEIGLGCDMTYGPGASVVVWKAIFNRPTDEIWEAEYDAECVEKSLKNGQLNGIHPLVGDQANNDTLNDWITKSGGKFDLVIDDGGHAQHQIYNSFVALWPHVVPGGIYFIEDLQVARSSYYADTTAGRNIIMVDHLYSWIEQLVVEKRSRRHDLTRSKRMPSGIAAIYCQYEACVIVKCDNTHGHSEHCS